MKWRFHILKAVMVITHVSDFDELHVSCTLQTVLVFYIFVGSWVILVSGPLGNGIRGKSYIITNEGFKNYKMIFLLNKQLEIP